MRKSFLASYPHSGNTWVRYIVEYFSKRYTEGLYQSGIPMEKSISNITELETKQDKPPILIKRHDINEKEFDTMPLLLLVRNYKQCIVRHNKKDKMSVINKKFIATFEGTQNPFYFYLIRLYDLWIKPKLLIYYEDLINESKEEKEIKKILDFLKIGYKRKWNKFYEDIVYHRNNSKRIYNEYASKIIDEKAEKKYLINKKIKKFGNRWDKYLKENFDIYDKYLSRYYGED